MGKSPKKPREREDVNTMAARIVAEATGEAPKTPDPDAGKDPAAVARGRKGGSVGGSARADRLPPAVRAEIAKKAADARWHPGQEPSAPKESVESVE